MRRDTDKRDALSGQLRNAEENVRGAREKLGDVRKRLAESDANLKRLAAERAQNEAALAKQRDVLAAELRSAYVGGREEQFKLLLSQEDPATLGRMLVYYSYFGRARAVEDRRDPGHRREDRRGRARRRPPSASGSRPSSRKAGSSFRPWMPRATSAAARSRR